MRYLLVLTYGRIHGVPPADEWEADDVRAHAAYQEDLAAELRGRGELVETQAVAGPDGALVVTGDGANPPVLRDGALTEPALAGYWLVEVASEDRALEIAGRVSAAPGPRGEALQQPVEVRAVVGPRPQ
ncbi:hypothetical protein GXB85_12785 [Cellulomonas sp. APG4]|uniref:YciI family protein n=1 Tax=Cellulomonas sp. APG4 TaxID=1538656 RepID=UPI00137A0BF3|nr:YciI family protein [Cellulomonas sp. APG4]NCT91821.1 hypothetical protein [Cellulomonas sp. APG4]